MTVKVSVGQAPDWSPAAWKLENTATQGVQISNSASTSWPGIGHFTELFFSATKEHFVVFSHKMARVIQFYSSATFESRGPKTKCFTSESQGARDFSGAVWPEKQNVPADYTFWPFQLTSWISLGHHTVRHKSH